MSDHAEQFRRYMQDPLYHAAVEMVRSVLTSPEYLNLGFTADHAALDIAQALHPTVEQLAETEVARQRMIEAATGVLRANLDGLLR